MARQTPLLVTPGFASDSWNCLESDLSTPEPADMPAHTYDAYIYAA